jgi:2-iminobutanoate/2-iminopropanoate deaminase
MPQATSRRIARVSSPQVAEPPPATWSNCLCVDGVAYVAGMIARGNDGAIVAGDEYQQSKVIFGKIRSLIEAAGGSMADVVKVQIFVTDITQREKVWRARREVFRGDFPVSTLVQVAALADPAVKVEIEAIAHIGAGARPLRAARGGAPSAPRQRSPRSRSASPSAVDRRSGMRRGS